MQGEEKVQSGDKKHCWEKKHTVNKRRYFWKTKGQLGSFLENWAFLRNKKEVLQNKRALLENKRAIPGNQRALLENKRVILENVRAMGIKVHF